MSGRGRARGPGQDLTGAVLRPSLRHERTALSWPTRQGPGRLPKRSSSRNRPRRRRVIYRRPLVNWCGPPAAARRPPPGCGPRRRAAGRRRDHVQREQGHDGEPHRNHQSALRTTDGLYNPNVTLCGKKCHFDFVTAPSNLGTWGCIPVPRNRPVIASEVTSHAPVDRFTLFTRSGRWGRFPRRVRQRSPRAAGSQHNRLPGLDGTRRVAPRLLARRL